MFPLLPLARALALLAGLAVGMAGCHDSPRSVETTVLQASGPVECSGRGTAPVTAGALLPPGGRVRATAGGSCVLSPLPGIMVRLVGPAELALDEVVLGKENDALTARRFRATLLSGHAQVWLDEPGPPSFDVAIRTPAGPVRLRRAALAEIVATGADTAEILCAEGTVEAEPAIEAGEGTWSSGAAATGFRPPQSAAEDEARWRRVVELREVEAFFARLAETQRLVRPDRLRRPAQK